MGHNETKEVESEISTQELPDKSNFPQGNVAGNTIGWGKVAVRKAEGKEHLWVT